MKRTWAVFVASVVLAAAASPAQALLIFNDRSTFLAATGASSATGPLPDVGFVPGAFTVGTVTFSITAPSSALFIGTGGAFPGDWTTALPGADIAISDVENLNADLAAPVYSLGFDFNEPSLGGQATNTCFVAVCTDSTFLVTLLSGGSVVGSFTYNAPDDVAAFVGVWSTVAFDRVEIRDLTATIDDEYWGQFYTGTRSPVPEPSTVVLVGAGLLVAALARRR
jgi:hypothetical protein